MLSEGGCLAFRGEATGFQRRMPPALSEEVTDAAARGTEDGFPGVDEGAEDDFPAAEERA